MNILAIETSCDDTCAAILEAKGQKNPSFKILSSIISSQVKIHRKWGGVYPILAKREHQKNLPVVLKKALKKAGNPQIDLIAVTAGPGLDPCLWTGVNFAKELAEKMKLPIVPVNHIEAHIIANWLTLIRQNQKLFPAVCLVVSGGHTQLILMNGFGKYKILGETRDDAAGECFDKTARILGLDYPGGPAMAKQAAKLKTASCKPTIKLPRPMIYQKNYDFSFSGLKTAVLYLTKQLTENGKQLTKKEIMSICKEIQQAIIDVLVHKTLKAAKDCRAKSVILGGGVAANEELRKQLNCKLKTINYKLKFLVPPKIFCTDNAAMIAAAAYSNQKKAAKNWKEIKVNANLKIDENCRYESF